MVSFAPPRIRKPPKLTRLDLCDRCGSPAQTRYSFESGTLYFCGHHANQFNDQLELQAKEVYDERSFAPLS